MRQALGFLPCGRQCDYRDVNESLYEWYILAYSKNICPMGPQLTEKAEQITTCLGKHDPMIQWLARHVEEAIIT